MKRRPAIIDTNVVVAGLLTADVDAPPARILDAMIRGSLPFVLSVPLLAAYRRVLTRPRISKRHGLTSDAIDRLLTTLAGNAIVREPPAAASAPPDPGDQHLWDLLSAVPNAVLVTGDLKLIDGAPHGLSAMSARSFLALD